MSYKQWEDFDNIDDLERAQSDYYWASVDEDKFHHYEDIRDALRDEGVDEGELLDLVKQYGIGGLADVYDNTLHKYYPDAEDPYEYIGEILDTMRGYSKGHGGK